MLPPLVINFIESNKLYNWVDYCCRDERRKTAQKHRAGRRLNSQLSRRGITMTGWTCNYSLFPSCTTNAGRLSKPNWISLDVSFICSSICLDVHEIEVCSIAASKVQLQFHSPTPGSMMTTFTSLPVPVWMVSRPAGLECIVSHHFVPNIWWSHPRKMALDQSDFN